MTAVEESYVREAQQPAEHDRPNEAAPQVTLVIPSPEAPTTVGTADSGGTTLAATVATHVDSVADMVAASPSAVVPLEEIRADVEDLRRDFDGTLERLRREDKTSRAAGE